jgi:hypothetical protein
MEFGTRMLVKPATRQRILLVATFMSIVMIRVAAIPRVEMVGRTKMRRTRLYVQGSPDTIAYKRANPSKDRHPCSYQGMFRFYSSAAMVVKFLKFWLPLTISVPNKGTNDLANPRTCRACHACSYQGKLCCLFFSTCGREISQIWIFVSRLVPDKGTNDLANRSTYRDG